MTESYVHIFTRYVSHGIFLIKRERFNICEVQLNRRTFAMFRRIPVRDKFFSHVYLGLLQDYIVMFTTRSSPCTLLLSLSLFLALMRSPRIAFRKEYPRRIQGTIDESSASFSRDRSSPSDEAAISHVPIVHVPPPRWRTLPSFLAQRRFAIPDVTATRRCAGPTIRTTITGAICYLHVAGKLASHNELASAA